MLLWHLHWVLVLLNSSTRAAKLQYSQHKYWVEVALRVDENGTCTRREWHLGWAKVALAHPKTTFCGFQGEQRGQKCAVCYALFSRMGVQVEGHWTIFALQVTGLAQSFSQQIWWALTSHRTRRRHGSRLLREPSTNGTDTPPGGAASLLHQTTATPPTECTERTEPSCRERTPTDGTDRHR